ncbi:MAG: Gfo/Idh/MocA family oxidoreductase [Planctomycetes bacterium]|nr:Gfo/Idh/MocA family oxidoreductase [Planctomycetota bacterium]
MLHRVTRRGLMKGAAAGAGLVILADPRSALGFAANRKLNVALIGVGGQGGAGHGMASAENIVALCDADEGRTSGFAQKQPQAKTYTDWRRLYDSHKNLNLVLVATPDHTHFPAAYSAVIRGCACYCEKPLTHGIWEARTLAEAVKKHRVPTQMGNQGHAKEGNRRVVEWVRAGVIGTVKEVHTWTNRPIWPQGRKTPTYTDPVPPTLNWDAWLGVAPKREYAATWREPEYASGRKEVYHPFTWRGWFDYGCGAVGDMGCHTWDSVWWSMDPRAPLSAEPVRVVDLGPEMFPRQMIVKWEFGPSAADSPYKRPGFIAFWYEGGLKPDVPEEIKEDPDASKKELPGSGSLFIGDKGKILVEGDYGDSPHLIPNAKMQEFKSGRMKDIPQIPKSPGHREELVMAAHGEQPWDFPKSNFMYAGPLVEAMNLANVAVRLGKKVSWDPKTLKCPGTPEADPLVKREYRKGWWNV